MFIQIKHIIIFIPCTAETAEFCLSISGLLCEITGPSTLYSRMNNIGCPGFKLAGTQTSGGGTGRLANIYGVG